MNYINLMMEVLVERLCYDPESNACLEGKIGLINIGPGHDEECWQKLPDPEHGT